MRRAWQPSRSHLSVITHDVLLDGVHFLGESLSACHIGDRALAARILSDIAAMGAPSGLATVGLGVAPGAQEAWLLELYQGT